MKFSILELFSQRILIASPRCQLRCQHCPIWSKEGREFFSSFLFSSKSVYEKSLFTYYPKKKIFHIIGGDPFCFDKLGELVLFLKSSGCKVVLWINGHGHPDKVEAILDEVDLTYLYVPFPDSKEYQDFTGHDGWDTCLTLIQDLKKKGNPLILNFPVTPMTIDYLPHIYELAYDQKLALLVHFDKADRFSRESLAYINRFKKIKNVFVFRNDYRDSRACLGVSYAAVYSKWQIVMNKIRQVF